MTEAAAPAIVDTPAAPPPAAPALARVLDTHYGRVVDVDAARAAEDPGRFAAVGAQTVKMIGPDGQVYAMPASSAQQARDTGWTWLGDDAAAHEMRVQAQQDLRYGSAAAVGARHAANQLFFGVPEIISQHDAAGGGQLAGEEAEAEARGDVEHGTAAAVGGAAGFLGGAALTGGLGSAVGGAAERGALAAASRVGAQSAEAALAPGLAARAFGYAARGAAEGALYAAPTTVAQAAYGDLDHAAESMLWGIGTGGLVGLGAGGFREAANATLGKMQGALRNEAITRGVVDEAGQVVPSKLSDLATSGRRELLGLTGAGAEKLAGGDVSALESFARERSLLGASPEKLSAAREAAQQAVDAHAGALDAAIGRAGKAGEGLGVSSTDLAAKVQQQVMETRPGLATPWHDAASTEGRKALDELTAKIADHGGEASLFSGAPKPLSFTELQKLKDSIPSLAGKVGGELTPTQAVAKQVAELVTSEQQRSMGEAFNKLGLTPDYAKYLGAKQNLQNLSQLADLAPRGLVPGAAAAPLLARVGAMPGQALAGAAGTVGGAVAGPLGGMLGYQIGKGVASRMLEHAAANTGLGLASKVLARAAESPESFAWLGPALAKNAVDQATARIASGVTTLGAQASRIAADPIKSYLGPQANGLSRDQQYDRVTSALLAGKADPSRVAAQTQTMAHVISGADPQLANAVAQKQTAALGYLASAVPTDPRPPQPFAGPSTWTPPPAAKQAFLDKLEIAQNPAMVLEHAKAGSLTAAHVDALSTLYPSTHAALVGELSKVAYSPTAPKLSEGHKQALSLLVGQPLNNPARINYQRAYEQKQADSGPDPSASPRGKSAPKMDKYPSLATGTQAIEARQSR